MKEISYFCNIFNRRIMGEKSLDVRMAQSVAPSSPTTSYNNSIPKLGEIIFNNNLNNFKVGNGNTAYGSLANFLGKTITNVSRNTSVTPNTTVITYSDNTTSTIPDGADGQDGTSVRIQPNAESCVAIGDGYIDTDGNLQVLTSLDPRTFTLAGQIRGPEGPQGATGNGISSISYFYTTTSSQTTPTAEDITSTTIPVLDSDTHKYLWQKEVVNYTNETSQTNISLIGVYGDTGAQGIDGTDGTTPHIDATTGNWFIGSTDTEVHAQGPQGESGPAGEDGKIKRFNITTWSTVDNKSIGTATVQDDTLEVGETIMCVHGSNQLARTISNIRIRINSTESSSKYFGFSIYGKNSNLDFYWEIGSWLTCEVVQLPTETTNGVLRIISIFNNTSVSTDYGEIVRMANIPNGTVPASSSTSPLLKPITIGNTKDGYIGNIIDTTNNTFLVTFIQNNNNKYIARTQPQRNATVDPDSKTSTRDVAFVDEIPTKTSDLTNDSNFATQQYVQDYVAQHGGSGTDEEAVHFTPQTLSSSEQAQARTNIGVTFETWTFYNYDTATVTPIVKSVCISSSTT